MGVWNIDCQFKYHCVRMDLYGAQLTTGKLKEVSNCSVYEEMCNVDVQ